MLKRELQNFSPHKIALLAPVALAAAAFGPGSLLRSPALHCEGSPDLLVSSQPLIQVCFRRRQPNPLCGFWQQEPKSSIFYWRGVLQLPLKCFLFSLLVYPGLLRASEPEQEKNTSQEIVPWFTGPLIAPIGAVIPIGHYCIQPFFEFNTATGIYNRHRHDVSTPNFFNFIASVQVTVGTLEWMDIQITPEFLYNHTHADTLPNPHSASSWRLGDLPLNLDFQLVSIDKFKYFPGIKFSLTESFPTGKYQKLNPFKLLTDIGGSGTFATTGSLVFYKIYHISGFHFLSMTTSLGYTYHTPVHVRGLNFYGGGPGCAGKVYPGNSFGAIASFEFSLDRHWALALDNVYVHFDRDRFKGTPGFSAPLIPAIVGRPSSESLSFAPAIEYNFNENWGIIAGAWVSAIGRNTLVFRNALLSFVYQY